MRRRWTAILALVWILPACELIEEPSGQFHARLDDAGGLREGAPVYVAGVRMGRVGIVRLDGDKARVDFTMDKDAALTVHEDACVAVGWYGAGEAHLTLRAGSSNRTELSNGSEVLCVEDRSQRTEKILTKAEDVVDRLASGKGAIGRLLQDEALATKVEQFFDRGAAESASSFATPASSAPPLTSGRLPVPKLPARAPKSDEPKKPASDLGF